MKIATRCLVALSLVAASPCWALDLTQKVKTMDGSDFVGSDGKPISLTLQSVIESSLLGEQAPNEEAKRQNYFLAMDVHVHAKEITFTPDQLVQIRKALAAAQPTAVYGQVMSAIDPTFLSKR